MSANTLVYKCLVIVSGELMNNLLYKLVYKSIIPSYSGLP